MTLSVDPKRHMVELRKEGAQWLRGIRDRSMPRSSAMCSICRHSSSAMLANASTTASASGSPHSKQADVFVGAWTVLLPGNFEVSLQGRKAALFVDESANPRHRVQYRR